VAAPALCRGGYNLASAADHNINYYVATSIGTAIDRGPQFRGTLQNVDVSKLRSVGHFNIDKNRAVQEMVIKEIRTAI
jgi:hypothetical protein